MKSALLVVSITLLLACGGSPQSSRSEAPTPAEDVTTAKAMHRHFEDVNAIERALISGDLASAHEHAHSAREGFRGRIPAGWDRYVERAVASAEMMEVTTDLGVAARLAGTMAGTCGDCHTARSVQAVQLDKAVPERSGDSFDDFMLRHRWATDRMWEGLIGPSNAAWNAGAAVLKETHVDEADVAGRIEMTPELRDLLGEIRRAAQTAEETQGYKERQLLFGNLLAGCAGCHRAMLDQAD
jgi:hypothetical protein